VSATLAAGISFQELSMNIFSRFAAIALAAVACSLSPAGAQGQVSRNGRPTDALHQMNDAVEALVQNVSPNIVHIIVTAYTSADDDDASRTSGVIGKHQFVGSGVIVDSEGYIVTNAHVVGGAQKIEVIVPPRHVSGAPADSTQNLEGDRYQARIVGVTRELDLAVIKIEAHALPAFSILGATRPLRQGQLVFAFGSPEGLRNTVTMGVVSAVARQPDPDSPLFYVQTDAPINPGNSGGALVDADGQLVGINTFILSTSGGNQGLGFAIPIAVVAHAYPQLLKFGHIHEPVIGASLQSITPELAAGLHLSRDFGLIVADIAPDGPAAGAGLAIQDIILTADGTAVANLPLFAHSLHLHASGEQMKLEVLRGSDRLTVEIPLAEPPHKDDALAALADPDRNLVRRLNILGITVDSVVAQTIGDLRRASGVLVAARTEGPGTAGIPLQPGDVIHALNGSPIVTLNALRGALAGKRPGDAVVLQIERGGQLMYIAFSL
jgi:serine protease Do